MPPASDSQPERNTGRDGGAISIEEIEDAVIDGYSPVAARTGTARTALSHCTFRIVFLGATTLRLRGLRSWCSATPWGQRHDERAGA